MTNNKITKELEKFVSSNDYKNYERKQISEKELSEKTIFVNSLEEIFDLYNIKIIKNTEGCPFFSKVRILPRPLFLLFLVFKISHK